MGSKKHKKKSDSSDSSSSDSDSSRDSSPAPKKHESKSKRNVYADEVPQKRHKKSSEERDKQDRRKRQSSFCEERHGDQKYSSKLSDRKRSKSRERNRSRERSRSKEHKDKYFDRNNQDQNRYEERQSRSDRYRDYGSKSNYRERVQKEETDRGGRDYRRDNNKDYRDRKYVNRRGRRSSSFDHANAKWGKNDDGEKNAKKDSQQKEKPNFGLSGKLTEETNTYRGVVIKYSEPPEARKPRRRWRLYPFKGEKALQTLYIHRESAYLIGRERKVVDLPVDHPSCSKQHAALQYRLVPFTREDGTTGKRVRPYLIDLESANGTFINNKKIEPKKYVELLERDVIKFGFSSREYVLLHENSKDEKLDDDVKQEEEEVGVKEEPE